MNNNNFVTCSRICVDCVANDPVDIRCGGPNYLGFDFHVREEVTEEMQKFIAIALETFDVPLTRMHVSGEWILTEKDVWTKERIIEEIKKDAPYLQSEARRNYYRSFGRR